MTNYINYLQDAIKGHTKKLNTLKENKNQLDRKYSDLIDSIYNGDAGKRPAAEAVALRKSNTDAIAKMDQDAKIAAAIIDRENKIIAALNAEILHQGAAIIADVLLANAEKIKATPARYKKVINIYAGALDDYDLRLFYSESYNYINIYNRINLDYTIKNENQFYITRYDAGSGERLIDFELLQKYIRDYTPRNSADVIADVDNFIQAQAEIDAVNAEYNAKIAAIKAAGACRGLYFKK